MEEVQVVTRIPRKVAAMQRPVTAEAAKVTVAPTALRHQHQEATAALLAMIW
jgi:hypothetical protein